MMNLAPLRYARVLLKHHGPIERIEYGRIPHGERTLYQANATLSRHLNLRRPIRQLFGNADGSGTHRTAIVARHMAISEAIERWALYYLNQAGVVAEYGFGKDPTSTGMAAYPGVWSGQARKRALAEAVERYCLVAWWEGLLRARFVCTERRDCEALEIENPLSRHRVALIWRRCASAYYAYGYSNGRSLNHALTRAEVEMERCAAAIIRHYRRNPGFELEDLDTIADCHEKRVLYFSLPEGHREFRARADAPASPRPPDKPAPCIDSGIPGPWSRYATVWRTMYPMPGRGYLGTNYTYFYW